MTERENEQLEAAKRVYERCIEIRNFEIGQLTNRNNFLMIFQGVLFAGLVQSAGTFPVVTFMACLTGVLVSWYQTKIAAGAKYWQEHWEAEVRESELRLLSLLEKTRETPPVRLFSQEQSDIKTAVRKRLEAGGTGLLMRALILEKFSVSKVPIQLGIALVIVWAILLICTIDFGLCFSVPGFITGFKH
jgi:hypothetical protein